MQLTVSGLLNQFQRIMQGVLFPALQEQLGPLTGKMRQLIAVLELVKNWFRSRLWLALGTAVWVGQPGMSERSPAPLSPKRSITLAIRGSYWTCCTTTLACGASAAGKVGAKSPTSHSSRALLLASPYRNCRNVCTRLRLW